MIEIRNIGKKFGDKVILEGISARFEPSNNSIIIGASGTGKSVLLKCIVGLIEPEEGEVLFNGRNFYISTETEKKMIRREIGMLFQSSALFDSKNVEENVRFPLDMLGEGMSESEKKDRVNFCLGRVGLENANLKMPSELSGGMKKRVGIARAIVLNPKYLFCDEPNSGLDPQTAIKIDELISEITDEFSITTIVVSHDMNSVFGIGEYVLFLHNGKKIWEGTANQIMEANVPELHDFIFAGKLMQKVKLNL